MLRVQVQDLEEEDLSSLSVFLQIVVPPGVFQKRPGIIKITPNIGSNRRLKGFGFGVFGIRHQ